MQCSYGRSLLEISVLMAQFPSREIARLSFEFRTLGLGYAQSRRPLVIVGPLLRFRRRPPDRGRAHRHHDGHELCHLGRDGGAARRSSRLRRRTASTCCASSATIAAPRTASAPATRRSRPRRCARPRGLPDPRLIEHAERAWDRALALGEAHGYRNAQVSVIAPTGTIIGLMVDCDTTGIEPDFALVKFKKLAGSGC